MNSINTIKTWSKSKQADMIAEIVSKYPTAKDFKNAVLQSGDNKSKALVQSMDENMPREQYVNFLQYMFVKHSKTGKILANSLVGLGIGAGLAYLLGKEAQSRAKDYQTSKETNIKYDPLKGKFDLKHTNLDDVKNSNVGKLATKISSDLSNNPITGGVTNSIKNIKGVLPDNINDLVNNPTGHLNKVVDAAKNIDYTDLATNLKNDIHSGGKNLMGLAGSLTNAYTNASEINNKIQRAGDLGKYAGGAVGLGVGGYGGAKISNLIQKWNEKKQQDKIDALKYSK